ncbi:hypothetical protein Goari_005132, partial [Gossypium aridum]|nr:hypothetical protein [Gossypium aridum]
MSDRHSMVCRAGWAFNALKSVLGWPEMVCSGNNGTAGISGILRDHKGASLVIFSKSAGLADPTLAEVLAIKFPGINHRGMPQAVYGVQLCFGICRGQSWDIVEIPNGTTDRLAKAGINRQ